MKRAENLEEILNAFQPIPLDEVNVPEFYYDNTMPTRMGHDFRSPLEDLLEDCTKLLLGANAHLLLGHGGSGKSTELINLKIRLKEAGQPVNIFRTELEANLYEADCWDIMLFITEGLCSIADDHKIKIPNNFLQSVFDYLKKDLEEIEETTTDASTSVSGKTSASISIGRLLELCAAIKGNLHFGTQTRTIIKEKVEKRASEWMKYIGLISDYIACEMDGKQPILIFEGFDKIQPPERAFEVFRHDILAKMPFPIIYTFPISLAYDPKFSSIESFYKIRVLPMIKVSNDDKTKNDDGIEVMRKIVELRANLELFDNNVLEYLIRQTGGVLRHLFLCITDASRLARRSGSDKIKQDDAERALSDLSSNLSRRISDEDHDALAKIYSDPDSRKSIGDKESLLLQMQALVVLEYQNGDRWHDLHPLIAKFLISQGVIKDQGVINVKS